MQKTNAQAYREYLTSLEPNTKPIIKRSPKINDTLIYNETFESLWKIYPKKMDKRNSERKYKSRLKEGYDPEFLSRCIDNYLNSEDGNGKTIRDRDKHYIKSLAVFFGRDKIFLEFTEEKEEKQETQDENPLSDVLN